MFLDFKKTISPDFDRIDVSTRFGSEAMDIQMQVGNTSERVKITIRSEESIRDLHYALSRYLILLDESKQRQR